MRAFKFRCNKSGTGSVACGRHWMIMYADDCCLHWQRGLYSHQAVYTNIGCCIFLFWPQYGTPPTATQLPFLNSSALSSDIQVEIPSFFIDFLPWHFICNHPPVGERHCCGLLEEQPWRSEWSLTEDLHWVVGVPSQHWGWHQHCHLITLQGLQEVSLIKWSGAIK